MLDRGGTKCHGFTEEVGNEAQLHTVSQTINVLIYLKRLMYRQPLAECFCNQAASGTHPSIHPSIVPSIVSSIHDTSLSISRPAVLSLNLSSRQSPFSQHWTFPLYGSLNISLRAVPSSLSSLISPFCHFLSPSISAHTHPAPCMTVILKYRR